MSDVLLCLRILIGALVTMTGAGVAAEATRSDVSPANRRIVTSLPQRFAEANSGAVPDFQKHVVPLIGRLGCNGRSCHGSFQGAGGFQLSLFGYDFQADHAALLDSDAGRVDVADVDESLILIKPTDADLHDGGKRMEVGSWQYNVLRAWIRSGASAPPQKPLTLERLVVSPREIIARDASEVVTLTATAHWQDGSVEDVTSLCRFSSNDAAVAEIDATGTVTTGQRGDTHVVVYYDNAVITVPVLRPASDLHQARMTTGSETTKRSPRHPVDVLVEQKLSKLAIEPSPLCSDSDFIRRIHLDVTGTLPTAAEVRSFLADPAPDKRNRTIERLLNSPGYATWWATRLSDWTGNSEAQLNNLLPVRGAGSRLWYAWLRKRLAENVPYDDIVAGIVGANNRQPGETYEQFCAAMTRASQPGGESEFADREGMPFFWARNNFRSAEDRAIGFAYTFLGVRIQCAQCHKHPFDQWSKDDFDHFARLFSTVQARGNTVAADARESRAELLARIGVDTDLRANQLRAQLGKKARQGITVPFPELVVAPARESGKQRAQRKKQQRKLGRRVKPKIPSGIILGQDVTVPLDSDPRDELMTWLRDRDNPYFARAIVNRVWANYFGIGIVDPTDDMNLANPPSNAALFDHLADGFITHDFDLHWLHRTITTSHAYQRDWKTNPTNQEDRTNFSRHIPHRHPAEVLYDSILLATAGDTKADQTRRGLAPRATTLPSPPYRNNNRDKSAFALSVFGQSIRETQCDCDRTEDSSLLQTIYLRNDSDIHRLLTEPSGWVAQQCETLGLETPRSRGVMVSATNKKRADQLIQALRKRVRMFRELPKQRRVQFETKLRKEADKTRARLAVIGRELPDYLSRFASPMEKATVETPAIDWAPVVEEAYLRALSRFPDPDETVAAVQFIEDSKTASDGIEGLLWTLINTKEFILSH